MSRAFQSALAERKNSKPNNDWYQSLMDGIIKEREEKARSASAAISFSNRLGLTSSIKKLPVMTSNLSPGPTLERLATLGQASPQMLPAHSVPSPQPPAPQPTMFQQYSKSLPSSGYSSLTLPTVQSLSKPSAASNEATIRQWNPTLLDRIKSSNLMDSLATGMKTGILGNIAKPIAEKLTEGFYKNAKMAYPNELQNPIPELYQPKNAVEKGVSFLGSMIGDAPLMAFNPGGAIVSKTLPALKPIAKTVLGQGITGGILGTAQGVAEGDNISDIAKRTALIALLGGGIGAVGHGISSKLQPKDLQLPKSQVVPSGLIKLPSAIEAAGKNISKTELPKLTIANAKIEGSILPEPQSKIIIGKSKEPIIPNGMKERGVSKNIRTDLNRPNELRDSFSVDPLVYKQLGNKETLAKAQSIFDEGFDTARKQVDKLLEKGQPEAAPLAKMLADRLTNEGDIVGARDLLSNAATKATEAGQFGQAFRILRDADPETFLMTFDKGLKKLNEEGLEAYGKKWKNVDLTPDELTKIGKIERGNQKSYDDVMEQIQARIANELPATAWEKVNAWRHISMLLNPKTNIRNVGGNIIALGMRRSAKQVSAVLQKVLLKPEDRTQVFKITGEYKQAATDYLEANKKDLLGGANKYNENVSLNMPNKRVFKNNALESTRKLTYKVLEMGDTPFYKNAYINRLASYAQAKGIKDFSELGQEAFDIAKKEAEQATYKDASWLASSLNKLKNPGPNAGLGSKAGAGLAEATLPFTKTPINIIQRGIQYSPAGILNGIYKWTSKGAAAAGIDEMAKGLTGTAILGLGYMLASKGILTGKASSDTDLKAYNANTGNSPFSILGKFTYDWAQPFAVPLTVGVEIYNAIKDKPEDMAKMDSLIAKNDTSKFSEMALTAANGIMEGLNASGDTVFNMSIMKGIKTLLGSGYNGFMEGLAQLPQNYATQFIPTLSSQLAGTIDPLVRNTYVPGNLPASFKNALISKIPIASKTLQPKQTPFGEDVKKIENPLGRAFSQFLSPGIIAKNQNINPKIDSELRRLNKYGLTIQLPTMTPNYIDDTQTHPRITLTSAEATQYQRRTGQLTLSAFSKAMDKGSYINAKKTKLKLPDEIKADLLAKAISDAKAQAKAEILKSRGLK